MSSLFFVVYFCCLIWDHIYNMILNFVCMQVTDMHRSTSECIYVCFSDIMLYFVETNLFSFYSYKSTGFVIWSRMCHMVQDVSYGPNMIHFTKT